MSTRRGRLARKRGRPVRSDSGARLTQSRGPVLAEARQPSLVYATRLRSDRDDSVDIAGSGDQFDRSSAQPSSSHAVPVRAPVVTRSCTAVERREAGAQ
ncbi:hypothetical protein V6N12_033921 [Hibiscus sabdariffa]|uniref:Uncharacterized protein n=1 Tax=Hibiscus sabdariffa TaxID=183260 RepID=A0ABR2AHC1_9ROSI